ncbi:MAG: hypothetical protein KJ067_03505 [Vicinamibacteria bacterium]|jgi:hypothetical protein|nr:hypothetical protein [Vicinamibacteria bacterium]
MSELFAGHPFWALLVAACLLWYSTITLAVAWRGIADIRRMLRDLRPPAHEPSSKEPRP